MLNRTIKEIFMKKTFNNSVKESFKIFDIVDSQI